MIVIPRKTGESVVIGDEIILTVIEVRGDKVRLGIELPEGGSLHTKEVFDVICRQGQKRASVTLETMEKSEG